MRHHFHKNKYIWKFENGIFDLSVATPTRLNDNEIIHTETD